jgi:hypothetical protein
VTTGGIAAVASGREEIASGSIDRAAKKAAPVMRTTSNITKKKSMRAKRPWSISQDRTLCFSSSCTRAAMLALSRSIMSGSFASVVAIMPSSAGDAKFGVAGAVSPALG